MLQERYRARVPDATWFQQVVPCRDTCPAHTDVPHYVKLVAEGRFDEAYLVNQRANVFPEILGRICARPCEKSCRRGRIDRPVAICHLKRSAGDHMSQLELLIRSIPKISENGRRVAVVGAGPAGLTAAQDLRNLGYAVTVYDAFSRAGGMLVGGIPAWRLPRDVVHREIDHYFAALGVTFRLNTRVGRDVALSALRREYDAVYLAAGTQTPQSLQIPGEHLANVYTGLAFMERVNLHPLPPIVGRRVAVIGGGFTAMDCARSALRLGAEQVCVLYRRTKAEIPVDEYELGDAQLEGVTFQYLVSPIGTNEDGRGGIAGLVCMRNRLGDLDAGGRPRAVAITGSEFTLAVDTLVVATGQAADFGWLGEERDAVVKNGRLIVDHDSRSTPLPGLFAGGDFVAGARNAISAIADGHRDALAIDRYLSGREDRRDTRITLTPIVPYLMPRDYTERRRAEMPSLSLNQRCDWTKGVASNLTREVETGYPSDLAAQEAGRCLLCYRSVTIDPEHCVICSRCVEYCPYDCIKLVPFDALEDAGGVGDLALTQFGQPLDFHSDGHSNGHSNGHEGVTRSDPFADGEAFIFDEDYCIRCGVCEAVCPTGALQIKLCELEEVEA